MKTSRTSKSFKLSSWDMLGHAMTVTKGTVTPTAHMPRAACLDNVWPCFPTPSRCSVTALPCLYPALLFTCACSCVWTTDTHRAFTNTGLTTNRCRGTWHQCLWRITEELDDSLSPNLSGILSESEKLLSTTTDFHCEIGLLTAGKVGQPQPYKGWNREWQREEGRETEKGGDRVRAHTLRDTCIVKETTCNVHIVSGLSSGYYNKKIS